MVGVTCTVSFEKGTKKYMCHPAKRSGPDPTREYTPLICIRAVNMAEGVDDDIIRAMG